MLQRIYEFGSSFETLKSWLSQVVQAPNSGVEFVSKARADTEQGVPQLHILREVLRAVAAEGERSGVYRMATNLL